MHALSHGALAHSRHRRKLSAAYMMHWQHGLLGHSCWEWHARANSCAAQCSAALCQMRVRMRCLFKVKILARVVCKPSPSVTHAPAQHVCASKASIPSPLSASNARCERLGLVALACSRRCLTPAGAAFPRRLRRNMSVPAILR
jgi:hypothetical protein